MDLLIGVSAGVIGLILGIVGIATAFNPPQSRSTKVVLTICYVALSAIATITTVLDRSVTENEAALSKKQLNELVDSSRRQTGDFLKLTTQLEAQQTALSDANQALREQLRASAQAQHNNAQPSLVKARAEALLKEIDSFVRERTESFSKKSAKMSQEEYRSSGAYMKFRRELSTEYISNYLPRVIATLNDAAELGAAKRSQYGVDERFVDAGMIPYVDELREAYSKLRD